MAQEQENRVPQATYEDLSVIMSEFERLKKVIDSSEAVTDVGKAYVAQLMEQIKGDVKSRMFYALMGYMVDSGRLKVKEPEAEAAPTQPIVDEIGEVLDAEDGSVADD